MGPSRSATTREDGHIYMDVKEGSQIGTADNSGADRKWVM